MEKKKDNIIEQEEKYRFWFAGLKGIRAAEKIKIAEEFPQKNTLYYIEETALKRRLKERMTDAEAEKIAEKIREGKALWDEKRLKNGERRGSDCSLMSRKITRSGSGRSRCRPMQFM